MTDNAPPPGSDAETLPEDTLSGEIPPAAEATVPEDATATLGAAPAQDALATLLDAAAPEAARDATILSTLVGQPAAPTVADSRAALSVDDIRREWGDVRGTGSATGTGTAVQIADPRSRQTATVNIALRRSSVAAASSPDAALDDYAIETRIGVGGMGAVFRARQASLNRDVAVKVILPAHAANEKNRAKFISEAVITGGLDHPNIIPLHELGVAGDGHIFYVMKEVKGREWATVRREKTEAENIDILLRVADAVAFAHDRGIIHRDLKPQNVMLGDFGEVLVMDWGLAVPYLPAADGTRVAMGRAGTPAYMAPEMARADDARIGPAADIYLLGAMLYEIATGLPPHGGENLYACIAAAANNILQPTPRDDELVAIARRAMAARPEERYASVKDFQQALVDYRRHQESVLLSERADDSLHRARRTARYDDYNRAVFGYSEALALWEQNKAARRGARAARLALAEQANAGGDYDLALSTLDAVEELPVAAADAAALDAATAAANARANDEVRALRRRVAERKAEAEARLHRIRRLRRIAVALGLLMLVVLTFAYLRVERERRIAIEARDAESAALAAEQAANEEKERASRAEIAALEQADKDKAAALAASEREKKSLEQANVALAREKEEREKREFFERQFGEAHSQLIESGWLEDEGHWTFDAGAAVDLQREAAREAGRPVALSVGLSGEDRPLRFALVPPVPGEDFIMGSKPREIGRGFSEYLHPVKLDRPYWVGVTELTRGQWRALVALEAEDDLAADELPAFADLENARGDWHWRTRPLPAEEADWPASGISVLDVQQRLLPKLALIAPEGLEFRLPTEAEWEWACRAGTATRYAVGNAPEDAKRAAWLDENAFGEPQAVARLEPNAWGLYDMHGNVAELVADYYSPLYYLVAPLLNPRNDEPLEGRPLFVARGGNALDAPAHVRSAARMDVHQSNRYALVGVRLVLAPPAAEPSVAGATEKAAP